MYMNNTYMYNSKAYVNYENQNWMAQQDCNDKNGLSLNEGPRYNDNNNNNNNNSNNNNITTNNNNTTTNNNNNNNHSVINNNITQGIHRGSMIK
ncbi:hypothetical protein PFDG_04497 [Plasmodium falciparum Dd2]|uniref:Uncharacterized protein n=1 Tax=Plasmodium falciparum (isolate Dd2) TaxID=57267 RepID=A0A0L7M5D9_PLAF4|nr:hypothetical protein PFDG_04497 [Plasmodium falciparum Dd2]